MSSETILIAKRFMPPQPNDSPFDLPSETLSAELPALKTKQKDQNEQKQSDRPKQ